MPLSPALEQSFAVKARTAVNYPLSSSMMETRDSLPPLTVEGHAPPSETALVVATHLLQVGVRSSTFGDESPEKVVSRISVAIALQDYPPLALPEAAPVRAALVEWMERQRSSQDETPALLTVRGALGMVDRFPLPRVLLLSEEDVTPEILKRTYLLPRLVAEDQATKRVHGVSIHLDEVDLSTFGLSEAQMETALGMWDPTSPSSLSSLAEALSAARLV